MATPQFLITTVAATLMLQTLSLLNAPNSSVQSFSTLGFANSAIAKESRKESRYRPPARPRPASRTNGTGSRGCQNEKGQVVPIALNLLVPDEHMGQTVSDRPTLFWYVENADVANVALVEPGVARPLMQKTVSVPKSGIMQIDLPQNAPPLKADKEYRWSVTVSCKDVNRNSNTFYSQAFIQRVNPSPELAQQLAAAKSDLERARIYAKAGLWYDALATYNRAGLKDPSVRSEMLSILDEVGLTRVTLKERANSQAANSRSNQ